MFSLASFHQKYETAANELAINGRKFNVLLPKSLTGFIDPQNVYSEFPFWAKIWPASWVLADYLSRLPVEQNKTFLEIGAGVGLVSVVAAAFGHNITLTEYNAAALEFARANAVVNGCLQMSIQDLDWNRPQPGNAVDYIVASEVTYKKEDWRPLISLFHNYLAPGGEVILTGEMKRSPKNLYYHMECEFNIQAKTKVLHSGDEQMVVFLFRLTHKD